MNTTIILAQIWGPVILAMGIGCFVSRSFYSRLYREIGKESLSVLAFGIMTMAAGIAQVLAHNVWDTFSQSLITLLGWTLLLKGAFFTVAPRVVDMAPLWEMKHRLVPFAGVIYILAGMYLIWIGYH